MSELYYFISDVSHFFAELHNTQTFTCDLFRQIMIEM